MINNLSTKLIPTARATNKICGCDVPLLKRRGFLAASSVTALLFGTQHSAFADTTHSSAEPIVQPAEANASAFVSRAFDMRQRAIELGDQAYGAVVVIGGVIVGQSWSRVIIDGDPTGHAEIAAIRDTARRLGKRDLSGAVLYSSSRPCPMCDAAAYWAGIGEIVHGPNGDTAGAPQLCR